MSTLFINTKLGIIRACIILYEKKIVNCSKLITRNDET